MGQCSARPHKSGPPGATPGSATSKVEYANRKSDLVESQVILQVRLLSRLLGKNDRVVQRRRRLRDMQKIDGSIPSAITFQASDFRLETAGKNLTTKANGLKPVLEGQSDRRRYPVASRASILMMP